MHVRTGLITGLSLLFAGMTAHAETVRIGTEGAYPPFNYIAADGTLSGFDIDIANALCAEMKVTCEFVTSDWDGIIPSLMAGKYDAIIASMSITEERKKMVDFTGRYYSARPALAVRKDSTLPETITPEALNGVPLGTQAGTIHSQYADKFFPESLRADYPSADEYKLDLESGRVDAVIDDSFVLMNWVNSEAGACCKILTTLEPDPAINGEGVGIAVRLGEDDLRERLSNAILAIRANGKYDEIRKKYFSFDIY